MQQKTYTDNEALARISYLTKTINHWNDLYRDGRPEVSDEEYDTTFQELYDLELLWPDFIRGDSPTARIKQTVATNFKSVKHVEPMLSLETMIDFSNAPLEAFLEKVAAIDSHAVIVQEFKYDGLALEIRYNAGVRGIALTRGDGQEGEDITANLERVTSINRLIDPRIERVRGELVLSTIDFDTINSFCEADGVKPYKTPRNAAAGIARSSNSAYVGFLEFYPYEVYGKDLPDSYLERIMMCSGKNCQVSRISFTASQKSVAFAARDKETDIAGSQLIPRDGLVYKVDSNAVRRKMGMNTQWPNWAYAHKFRPASVTTVLRDIVLTVGRTGKIAPTGTVGYCTIDGVDVSNVFLHNEAKIVEKDLRLGDRIVLERAGDVIPYVRGLAQPIQEERSEPWKMPSTCPCCGGPIKKEGSGDKESVDYFCHAGFGCRDQALGLFEYAASRGVLDIKGLGPAIIESLYKHAGKGGTPPFARLQDIFKLDVEAITAAGVSPLIAEKIVSEIEAAKHSELWRGIAALGIRLVGPCTAKEIAKHCHVITDIASPGFREKLTDIEDVGEATAANISDFLDIQENIEMLEELQELTNFKAPQVQVRNGLTVCVSGSFNVDKNTIKKDLEELGFKVTTSVSKNLSALVTGFNPGPDKLQKATKLGIPVFDDPDGKMDWAQELIKSKKA